MVGLYDLWGPPMLENAEGISSWVILGSQSLVGWIPARHIYVDTGRYLQAATCSVFSERVQRYPCNWGLPHVLEFCMLS